MAALPQAVNLGQGFADPMDPCTQCEQGMQEIQAAYNELNTICNSCQTQRNLTQQTSGSCAQCQQAQQTAQQVQQQISQMGGCTQCAGQPTTFQQVSDGGGQPIVSVGTTPLGQSATQLIGQTPGPTIGTPLSTSVVTQPANIPQLASQQPFTTAQLSGIPATGSVSITGVGPPLAQGGSGKVPTAFVGPEGFLIQAGGIGPTVPTLGTPAPAFQYNPMPGGGFVMTPAAGPPAPVPVPVTPAPPAPVMVTPTPPPPPPPPPPTIPNVPPFSVVQPVPAPVPTPAPAPITLPVLTPGQIQAAQNIAASLSALQSSLAAMRITAGPPGGISLSGVPSTGFPGGVG